MGAGRPKSIDNSKVFDVAKPGKTKPISTSRPVVGQTITVRDNSMLTNTAPDLEPSSPLSAPSVTRKVIKPLTTEDTAVAEDKKPAKSVANFTETAPELAVPIVEVTNNLSLKKDIKKLQIVDSTTDGNVQVNKSTVDKQTTPVTDVRQEIIDEKTSPNTTVEDVTKEEVTLTKERSEVGVQTADTPEVSEIVADSTEENEKPAVDESQAESSESASVDALAEASEKPKQDQKVAEEQAKRDAALQELIDSKKYFVPLAHDSSQNKKSSGVGFIILILLMIVLAAYLLVDAEIVKTNISLPYQFFK